MRQSRTRPGGRIIIQFSITNVVRLRRSICDHGGGMVALIELDAMTVELVVLEFDGLTQFLSLLSGVRRVLFACLYTGTHLLGISGLIKTQCFIDCSKFLDALVRSLDYLLTNGRTFSIIGL